jgi:hypothetical protein
VTETSEQPSRPATGPGPSPDVGAVPGPGPSSATTRAVTAALLLSLGTFCVLAVARFAESDWRHYVDSAIYLLTAKSLALGDGYTYLGRPFFVRPPGLSWVLSHGVAEGFDFATLNLFIQVCVAGTLLVLLLALSRIHTWAGAALVCLLFAVNPLALEAHNEILAEYPFMVLLFAAAWLLADRGPAGARLQAGLGTALLGAVLLAAAAHFRTIAILLLPGLVLIDLFRRDGRRWQGAAVAGVVALALIPWTLYTREATVSAERPSAQLLMYDYGTAMFHTNPSDPESPLVDAAGWLARLSDNATEVSQTLAHCFLGGPPNSALSEFGAEAPLIAALLGAAMLFTWLSRRSLLDWYMAAYVALLLTYFTFADRLILPLVPMMLSSVIYSLQRLGARFARSGPSVAGPSVDPGLAAVTLFALALGGLHLSSFDESRSITSTRKRFYRADRATAAWIEANTRPDDVLLHEKGSIFTVLTGRVTYTYRNLPGPWPEGCPDVDYAIFSPRQRREVTEGLIAAVTPISATVPFKWKGEPSQIRIYTLRDTP